MNKTTTNLKDLIDSLDAINSDKYAFHVFVPSLQRDIPFTQITTGQQKSIIKSIIDSPVYNTEFIFCMYNIIKENCLDKSIKMDELTLLDKLIIELSLRSKSIGNLYDGVMEQDGTEYKYSVEIDSLLDLAKSIPAQESKVLEMDPYTITVGAPTIGREYLIERDIRSKVTKPANIQNDTELREIIGEAFITELIKFIKTIEVKKGEDILTFDFNSIQCRDQITILSKIPVKLLEGILSYANQYNTNISDVLKIQVPTRLDPETNKIIYGEQQLEVSGSFFTIS